jgi:hypothetical protein
MSTLVVNTEVTTRIMGIVWSAVGKSYEATLRHAVKQACVEGGTAAGLILLHMKVELPFSRFLDNANDDTLGFIAGLGQRDNAEIPESCGNATPEGIYGMTGYKPLLPHCEPKLATYTSWRVAMKEMAIVTLTCFLFDHLRQDIYRAMWQDKVEEVRGESGC